MSTLSYWTGSRIAIAHDIQHTYRRMDFGSWRISTCKRGLLASHRSRRTTIATILPDKNRIRAHPQRLNYDARFSYLVFNSHQLVLSQDPTFELQNADFIGER